MKCSILEKFTRIYNGDDRNQTSDEFKQEVITNGSDTGLFCTVGPNVFSGPHSAVLHWCGLVRPVMVCFSMCYGTKSEPGNTNENHIKDWLTAKRLIATNTVPTTHI